MEVWVKFLKGMFPARWRGKAREASVQKEKKEKTQNEGQTVLIEPHFL